MSPDLLQATTEYGGVAVALVQLVLLPFLLRREVRKAFAPIRRRLHRHHRRLLKLERLSLELERKEATAP